MFFLTTNFFNYFIKFLIIKLNFKVKIKVIIYILFCNLNNIKIVMIFYFKLC